MPSLRLEVFEQTATDYQLRFFTADNTLVKSNLITKQQLSDFVATSEQHYQDGLSLPTLGKQLFAWLDEQGNLLHNYRQLQIPATHNLPNLAWELLYNDDFLCANRYSPFTPLRLITKNKQTVSPANRPLRLLFMACAPENLLPKLNFENEESLILAAIDPANIDLVVEESGTLEGLRKWLVNTPKDNFFDVVHLTGHAGKNEDGEPVFMMEDDTGQKSETTAEQIADIFNEKGIYPRLVFLSGCETAHSNDSLCAALVKAGIPAVLGWAKPIGDNTASETAKILYSLLAEGANLARSVAKTRLALIDYEQKKRDKSWHYLRFYSDDTPAIALVTALDTPDRKAITPPVIEDEFFKTERVCPASRFVGRRKFLRYGIRCLRASKQDKAHYAQGMLLHGMGGLGKSSLAARLCDRLKTHFPERLILIGKLDETALKQVFGQLLHPDIAAINAQLNTDQPLNTRLGLVFKQFPQLTFLIVLDDFEQNINIKTLRVEPTAYTVLTALLSAIHQSNSKSRVIITSRYSFEVANPLHLLALDVIGLRDADLQKKIRHLINDHQLEDLANDHAALFQQATKLGAGNPRLLERLYQLLAVKNIDAASIFQQLANKEIEFQEELLLKILLSYQTKSTRQLCAIVALFDIFIPKQVLAAVFDNALLEPCLAAALAVGLIEVNQERYFVSRLLLPLLKAEWADLAAAHVSTASPLKDWQCCIFAQAAQCLSALWWDSDYDINEEEIRELIRVARAGERKEFFVKPAGVLADSLYAVSSYNEAHALYEELLPIQRELSDRQGEGVTLNYMSAIAYAKGDYDTALRYLTDSLKIMQNIDDKKGEGATLNNMSVIAHAKGDYDTALRYLTDSLKIMQDIDDKRGEGATLNNISQIYRHGKGDNDTALRYLTDSLKIQQDIGDKKGEGATLNNISQIYDAKGDYDTALRYLTDSLKITQDIGDSAGLCATLFNMGHIHWQADQQEQAIATWLQAYKIAKQIGLAQALANLENLAKQQGGEGLAYWEALSQATPKHSDV
jgi:tetratricopeptide (TPR) repeat protein